MIKGKILLHTTPTPDYLLRVNTDVIVLLFCKTKKNVVLE